MKKTNGLNGDVVDVDAHDVEVEIDDDKEFEDNCCTGCLNRGQESVNVFLSKNGNTIWMGIKIILLVLYMAYFGYCMYYRFGDEGSISLLVATIIGALYIVYKLTPGCGEPTCLQRLASLWGGNSRVVAIRRWIRRLLYVLFLVGVAIYIGVDVLKDNPGNTQALLGVVIFLVLCFFMSTSPARINWYTIFWCMSLQLALALLILRTSFGYSVFDWLGLRIDAVLKYGNNGAERIFGKNYRDHLLVFSVLPVMMFFNSLVFLLYHTGVFQVIIRTFGNFVAFFLDLSPLEPFMALGNIVVGLLEAPLLARPFLKRLTMSELHAIMTCGFATVSAGVLGTFVLFGAPANHLLSASVISAPAALAVSKLVCPETKESVFGLGEKLNLSMKKEKNVLAAITSGAIAGLKVVANIVACQLIFTSLLKLSTVALEWFGDRAGVEGLTFEFIFSYVLWPITYIMGVVPQDCRKVGALIGKKFLDSPISTYLEIGIIRKNRRSLLQYVSQYNNTWSWEGGNILLSATNQTLVGGVMQEKSEVIATYAVCGFSSVSSVAVMLASLLAMAPERKHDYYTLLLRAFISGYIASFMTGAIAGLLFKPEGFTAPPPPVFAFPKY